ncbi:unnamed protein product [Acanthosepion pharaonis]|uniref:Uncharacterized protein n=1 Tax=Acanthosepion pharaonis TaxID=158019 RepID=A0A812DKE9_ACAPH|nr:unnamed protein product [Sepia pharaonis]
MIAALERRDQLDKLLGEGVGQARDPALCAQIQTFERDVVQTGEQDIAVAERVAETIGAAASGRPHRPFRPPAHNGRRGGVIFRAASDDRHAARHRLDDRGQHRDLLVIVERVVLAHRAQRDDAGHAVLTRSSTTRCVSARSIDRSSRTGSSPREIRHASRCSQSVFLVSFRYCILFSDVLTLGQSRSFFVGIGAFAPSAIKRSVRASITGSGTYNRVAASRRAQARMLNFGPQGLLRLGRVPRWKASCPI